MKVKLSGGDFGGQEVEWKDNGFSHMKVGDFGYRLHETEPHAVYVGLYTDKPIKTEPPKAVVEKTKKPFWFLK